MSSQSDSKNVESTLQHEAIHESWENRYRTVQNEKFYDLAFDEIVRILKPRDNSTLLDAGCGPCNYTIRLAKSGKFNITAADISESALKLAEQKLRSNDLHRIINLRQENITALSFPDESFDYVLCWGVLMHIPDIEKAISELSRVLKKGGLLVISEVNMHSFQCRAVTTLKQLLRKNNNVTAVITDAGIEYWQETSGGKLVTRHTNNAWLINKFKSHGLGLKKHMAGQFSEFYTMVSTQMLISLVHAFNYYWFKYVKSPHLACCNLFIFERK